ncbi:MAG: pseudouridine synthase [Cyanobacteriota bacterium]|nr:pseudouridine synthase [Cyanobacteriota bacterium]
MEQRLQKILSQWGIASRRKAEEMIIAGRVRVNSKTACLGEKANPEGDLIEVDGHRIEPGSRPQPAYLLLNKPAGVVSTCVEPGKRKKVLDLLPPQLQVGQGIHPVGRLDVESTGALLLTNDGQLTYCLTHPKHQVPKIYEVWVEGRPSEKIIKFWCQGIILSGKKTLPAKVRVLEKSYASQTLLEVVIYEGRNRLIRRVAEQLGHPVLKLHRTAIGQIKLQPPGEAILPGGQYRPLKTSEMFFLQKLIN